MFSVILVVSRFKTKQKIGNKPMNEADEGSVNRIQPEQIYDNVMSSSSADVETDKNIAYDIVHASN